jgi:hypothetical protein
MKNSKLLLAFPLSVANSAPSSRFVEAFNSKPSKWTWISKQVGTRSNIQCRTHAQKFFQQLDASMQMDEENSNHDHIPTPPPPLPLHHHVTPPPRRTQHKEQKGRKHKAQDPSDLNQLVQKLSNMEYKPVNPGINIVVREVKRAYMII